MTDLNIMNIWRALNDRSVEERAITLGRACYREGFSDCIHDDIDRPNPYQVIADLLPALEASLYVARMQPDTPQPETDNLDRAIFKLKQLIEE